MSHILHVTTEGERWDQLSWRYYGSPWAYEAIIAANPEVMIVPRLPAGVSLRIPLRESDVPTILQVGLPPWKRAT